MFRCFVLIGLLLFFAVSGGCGVVPDEGQPAAACFTNYFNIDKKVGVSIPDGFTITYEYERPTGDGYYLDWKPNGTTGASTTRYSLSVEPTSRTVEAYTSLLAQQHQAIGYTPELITDFEFLSGQKGRLIHSREGQNNLLAYAFLIRNQTVYMAHAQSFLNNGGDDFPKIDGVLRSLCVE